jgi:hypothetical protein
MIMREDYMTGLAVWISLRLLPIFPTLGLRAAESVAVFAFMDQA